MTIEIKFIKKWDFDGRRADKNSQCEILRHPTVESNFNHSIKIARNIKWSKSILKGEIF